MLLSRSRPAGAQRALPRARLARVTFAAFAALVSTSALGLADPPERTSTSSDRERVNLTIYNGGSSLVHDRRRVRLNAGENAIAWRDVSANIDATTAVLSDLTLPGGAAVVEQNFDFDLLKPTAILDKYVGHDVIVVHDDPHAGLPKRERARLLADNEGVVLQYADRVETNLDGAHLVFPAIPRDLRDRPTLVLDVASKKAGTQSLDLAYLTAGLGWRTDYVGVVAPDEKRVDVNGLVTLTNTTGTTFTNARLQLVAGNVNIVPSPNLENGLQPNQTADTYAVAGFSQENYFEYHLYTLGRPTTVANAQTKQVALLAAKNVPLHKTLELRGSDSYYSNPTADLGTKLKVGVYLTFTNKGGDLGIPLPGGIFRLYKNDSKGTSQFLGSDTIDHTPRDQDVRLHVGDSFDVTANKKQTDFKGLGRCTADSTYKIAVSNAKDDAQDVLIVEPIPGTWTIPAENFPHVKSSSATATWTVHVPSRKTVTLEYTAHVYYCI